MPRTGLKKKHTDPLETGRLHGFLRKTFERDDVVIVVRKCCVNLGTVEVKVVHPGPSVKGWCMTPVTQGPVNDFLVLNETR